MITEGFPRCCALPVSRGVQNVLVSDFSGSPELLQTVKGDPILIISRYAQRKVDSLAHNVKRQKIQFNEGSPNKKLMDPSYPDGPGA